MNFQQIHELLRLELLRRIEQGVLTGTQLAKLTGFRQAHVSNFLNRKRALSLEGLDRMLAAQDLEIEQIIPIDITAAEAAASSRLSQDIEEFGSQVPDSTAIIPVVAASAAADEPHIRPALVIETVHVSAARLLQNRARVSHSAANWQRFVAIRVNAQQAAAMHAVLAPGTIAIIDRHYNSLAPYRTDQPTIYAVRYGSGLVLRFIEFDDGQLVLRPSSIDYPVHLLGIGPHETASDFIVGRVCLLIHEL